MNSQKKAVSSALLGTSNSDDPNVQKNNASSNETSIDSSTHNTLPSLINSQYSGPKIPADTPPSHHLLSSDVSQKKLQSTAPIISDDVGSSHLASNDEQSTIEHFIENSLPEQKENDEKNSAENTLDNNQEVNNYEKNKDAAEEEEDDDDDESNSMSFRGHLRELRKRLFLILLWACAGFLPCYAYGTQIFIFLKQPLIDALPAGSEIIFTGLPDGFFTELKIAFLAGIFLASPMIFYQIWSFIAPGLYKNEKRFILPVAFFSAFFFISGAAFCYYVTFPFAFKFFLSYNDEHMKAMLSVTQYLSFALQLLFAFGLVFELPLFTFFFAKLGLVTAAWMRKMRRYAILVIVIVAAILTPPDVISQLLMSLPMLILYEVSIFIAAIFGKKPLEETSDTNED